MANFFWKKSLYYLEEYKSQIDQPQAIFKIVKICQ